MTEITVDFSRQGIEYNNCTLNNNWCDDFHFPESYKQDMEYLVEEKIGFDIFRLWIKIEEVYDKESGCYDFERYYHYIETAATNSNTLLLNFSTNTANDPMEWTEIIKNILVHYKKKFQNIVYIECLNEPDLAKKEIDLYYRWYQCFYRAVTSANKEVNTENKLLLGGPVLALYNSDYLEDFLARYSKDMSTEKLLDFISIHDYAGDNDGDGPIRFEHINRIYDIRKRLEISLRSNNISTDLPLFVTEIGVFPGQRGTDCLDDDMYAQCAGCAAIVAMYGASSEKNYIFHWAIRHKTNPRKNIIPEGELNKLTPYGRLLKLLAPMKGKVAAVSPGYDSYTNGPGAFAVVNNDCLHILLWNYRYVDYKSDNETVKLTLKGIPFEKENLRLILTDLEGKKTIKIIPAAHTVNYNLEMPRNSVFLLRIEKDPIKIISQPDISKEKIVELTDAKVIYADNVYCFSEIRNVKKISFNKDAGDKVIIERSFDGHFWEAIYNGNTVNGEVELETPVQALMLREKNGTIIVKTENSPTEYICGCENSQRQHCIKKNKLIKPALLNGEFAYLVLKILNRDRLNSVYVETELPDEKGAILKISAFDSINGWRKYKTVKLSQKKQAFIFEINDTSVSYLKLEAQGEVNINKLNLLN